MCQQYIQRNTMCWNENNFIKMRNTNNENTKYGFNKICASNENDIKIIFVIYFGVWYIHTHRERHILWLKRSLDRLYIYLIPKILYKNESLKLSLFLSFFFLFQLTKLLTSTHPKSYIWFLWWIKKIDTMLLDSNREHDERMELYVYWKI